MTEDERKLGQRWFDEVWNKGRREAIGEMFSSQGVLHDGANITTGPDAFYEFFDRIQASLSGMHIVIDDTIAEGDKVVVRWTSTATHSGNGLGMPPTNKTVRITGISILRVKGSQFVEAWQNWDMLGLMEQVQEAATAATYVAQ
ncbi:MAG TPA: ester cyclase [Acidobacteriaceae bacterium]|jgi:predicted ester cyclase|nr:ester cyclase [Acidobacteriaceae bacterium]